jgi:hypothetical protein
LLPTWKLPLLNYFARNKARIAGRNPENKSTIDILTKFLEDEVLCILRDPYQPKVGMIAKNLKRRRIKDEAEDSRWQQFLSLLFSDIPMLYAIVVPRLTAPKARQNTNKMQYPPYFAYE